MGQTEKLEPELTIEVLDHLPRWAYTSDEWREEVLNKTHTIINGIRYYVIIPEPETKIDLLLNDLFS